MRVARRNGLEKKGPPHRHKYMVSRAKKIGHGPVLRSQETIIYVLESQDQCETNYDSPKKQKKKAKKKHIFLSNFPHWHNFLKLAQLICQNVAQTRTKNKHT